MNHISAISIYMHLCLHLFLLELRHIQQNKRVIQGRDGNLYFSHVTVEDSRDDYTCNTQFPSARIIVLKEPIKLNVVSCKHQDRGYKLSLTYLCLSLKTFSLNRGERARHWVFFYNSVLRCNASGAKHWQRVRLSESKDVCPVCVYIYIYIHVD